MNLKQIVLRNAIIAGTLSGAQLQTELANAASFSNFQVLVADTPSMEQFAASTTAMTTILGSALATGALKTSQEAMANLANNPVGLGVLLDISTLRTEYVVDLNARAILNGLVNVNGGKLKRQVFTASGTWTYPTSGLHKISVACVGGGGGGGSANGTIGSSGGGGAGGAIAASTLTVSSITGNVTVTVGSGGAQNTAGGSTSFGAHLTATGGSGGTAAGSGVNAAGGAAVGSDSGNWLDTALTTTFWQQTASVQSGGGGTFGTNNNGFDAVSANSLTLGTGGSSGTNAPGTAYGGGGASGGAGGAGVAAAANSGAGGGGGRGNGSGQNGGAGGSGLVVVYWVEN